jgi:hypothetical protein
MKKQLFWALVSIAALTVVVTNPDQFVPLVVAILAMVLGQVFQQTTISPK